MLRVILTAAAVGIVSVFMALLGRRQQKREKNRQRAVNLLFRETMLTEALSSEELSRVRFMDVIFLAWKDEFRREYAFLAAKGVNIGRDPDANEICIWYPKISGRHCRIFSAQGHLYVTDFDSLNGTFIRRGLTKRRVRGTVEIPNGVSLYVGDFCFKINAKVYDSAYM